MKKFIKNVSYVAIANIISLFVSGMITILLPKYLTPSNYGYWQLYLLFITYIGCIHLGIPDGIYLRHSGKRYEQIVNNQTVTLFWLLSFWEVCFGILIWLVYIGRYSDVMAPLFAFCTGIYVPSIFLKYIFLASGKMYDYSCYIVIEKVIILFGLLLLILFKSENISLFITMDIIGKFVALLYAFIRCKEFFIYKIKFNIILKLEFFNDLKAGCCLMISTISSNFIVGAIRIFIERQWSIEQFGKVSLSLQISNFILAFVRAISLPLFPYIRSRPKEFSKLIYGKIRLLITTIIAVLMIFYFPLKVILEEWLVSYSDSIFYLGILFPICLFETKQSLICDTFLKNFRKERFLLFTNLLFMAVSVICGYVVVFIFSNQIAAVYLITIMLGIRTMVSELYLNKLINNRVIFDIMLEMILVFVFIISNQLFSTIWGMVIYIFFTIIYLFSYKNEFKIMVLQIRKYSSQRDNKE